MQGRCGGAGHSGRAGASGRSSELPALAVFAADEGRLRGRSGRAGSRSPIRCESKGYDRVASLGDGIQSGGTGMESRRTGRVWPPIMVTLSSPIVVLLVVDSSETEEGTGRSAPFQGARGARWKRAVRRGGRERARLRPMQARAIAGGRARRSLALSGSRPRRRRGRGGRCRGRRRRAWGPSRRPAFSPWRRSARPSSRGRSAPLRGRAASRRRW